MIEGLKIMERVPEQNIELMYPKEIPLSSYSDVFKEKVQLLLPEEDKEWWKNFKSDQGVTIGPSDRELEEYRDIWDVNEGEVEDEYAHGNRMQTRTIQRITVTDHPIAIGDIDEEDIVVIKSGRKDFTLVRIKHVHIPEKMIMVIKLEEEDGQTR